MHILSIQLLIPQWLSIHNWKKTEKLLKTTIFFIFIKGLFFLVFTQTSHIAKSHIDKSIIENTQIPNQAIKCDFHVLWYLAGDMQFVVGIQRNHPTFTCYEDQHIPKRMKMEYPLMINRDILGDGCHRNLNSKFSSENMLNIWNFLLAIHHWNQNENTLNSLRYIKYFAFSFTLHKF